jgi:Skp family chaperone for outer membrane proteins
MRTADAAQAVADAQRARDAAFELQTEVSGQREALDAMRTELEDRERTLRERESELVAKESELTARQQELDGQAAQQEQRQQENENQAWFYWSCKDARKAGVAPIQQGQPGYRGALDPDDNGLACEDGEN